MTNKTVEEHLIEVLNSRRPLNRHNRKTVTLTPTLTLTFDL